MSLIKESHEISAAWVNVAPFLRTKQRGEELLYTEIESLAPNMTWRLRRRIRAYFASAGVELISLGGKGWRLATDEEHVREVAPSKFKRGTRAYKKGHAAALSAREANLSSQAKQLRDHQIRHSSAQIIASELAGKDAKAILGVPEPRPQLRAKTR